ncbi:hypothetical protein KVR01_011568 [Diaporthe batatas]|uniref:uncharacterized protein n=1 Tax=Diaporthe batatas TaxID=748121 RepID=UPI001D04AE4A|nr:uncharacterized protein KVR01_011568 [Diaporthe batatas]KAG8158446.1 hypothetical protein KVR01_011568 [Diaporthe batatas]
MPEVTAADRQDNILNHAKKLYSDGKFKAALAAFKEAILRCPCTRDVLVQSKKLGLSLKDIQISRCHCKDFDLLLASTPPKLCMYKLAKRPCTCGSDVVHCNVSSHLRALDGIIATYEKLQAPAKARQYAILFIITCPHAPQGYLRLAEALRLGDTENSPNTVARCRRIYRQAIQSVEEYGGKVKPVLMLKTLTNMLRMDIGKVKDLSLLCVGKLNIDPQVLRAVLKLLVQLESLELTGTTHPQAVNGIDLDMMPPADICGGLIRAYQRIATLFVHLAPNTKALPPVMELPRLEHLCLRLPESPPNEAIANLAALSWFLELMKPSMTNGTLKSLAISFNSQTQHLFDSVLNKHAIRTLSCMDFIDEEWLSGPEPSCGDRFCTWVQTFPNLTALGVFPQRTMTCGMHVLKVLHNESMIKLIYTNVLAGTMRDHVLAKAKERGITVIEHLDRIPEEGRPWCPSDVLRRLERGHEF